MQHNITLNITKHVPKLSNKNNKYNMQKFTFYDKVGYNSTHTSIYNL